ncbi:MAG: sigma factor [Candidatus Aenigmatarchaeota archaeon]
MEVGWGNFKTRFGGKMGYHRLDLESVGSHSKIIETEMFSILSDLRVFYESVVDSLKGKRPAKTNFNNIEDPEVDINVVRQTISDMLLDWPNCDKNFLKKYVSWIDPKRIFLYNTVNFVVGTFNGWKNIEFDDSLLERFQGCKIKRSIVQDIGSDYGEEEIFHKMENLKKKYLDSIITKLCDSHVNLVRKVVKDNFGITSSIPYEERLSYGFIGLLKAAHKFDFDSKYKFSTYARWWIWESVMNGINTDMYYLSVPSTKKQKYIKYLSSSRKNGEEHAKNIMNDDELGELYFCCNPTSLVNEEGDDVPLLSEVGLSENLLYKSNPEDIVLLKEEFESRI